jgi:hypothetical protein
MDELELCRQRACEAANAESGSEEQTTWKTVPGLSILICIEYMIRHKRPHVSEQVLN